jgi:hypothetical protein
MWWFCVIYSPSIVFYTNTPLHYYYKIDHFPEWQNLIANFLKTKVHAHEPCSSSDPCYSSLIRISIHSFQQHVIWIRERTRIFHKYNKAYNLKNIDTVFIDKPWVEQLWGASTVCWMCSCRREHILTHYILLPPSRNRRCFSFVKLIYLDIFLVY